MIQRDYFMRMTQMLAAVLAKVLFNKEEKKFEDAQLELESAAKSIVGIDLKIINILNIEDIMKLMKTSDVYAGRCIISAELLKEYGDILGEKNKPEESINVYKKSLYLYMEAVLTKEIPEAKDYFARINFLINILSPLNFTADYKQKIFGYYEISGQYSKAEDILFEMVDDKTDGISGDGIKFYKRLQNIPDENLSAGNFSSEEVEEGLSELIGLKKNI